MCVRLFACGWRNRRCRFVLTAIVFLLLLCGRTPCVRGMSPALLLMCVSVARCFMHVQRCARASGRLGSARLGSARLGSTTRVAVQKSPTKKPASSSLSSPRVPQTTAKASGANNGSADGGELSPRAAKAAELAAAKALTEKMARLEERIESKLASDEVAAISPGERPAWWFDKEEAEKRAASPQVRRVVCAGGGSNYKFSFWLNLLWRRLLLSIVAALRCGCLFGPFGRAGVCSLFLCCACVSSSAVARFVAARSQSPLQKAVSKRMKNVVAVRAIADHVTTQPGLLSFIAGETFAVVAKPSKTWWKGVSVHA